MALSTLELTDYISGKVYLFKGDFGVIIPPNVITGATNLGTGTTIFTSAVNNNLQFRSLKVLGGLTISNDGSYVYLSGSSGSTGGGTITGATNGLLVTGKNIQLGGTLTGNTVINTANFGLAFGSGSTAIGINSFAEGSCTIASGITSHAEGCKTCSIGNYSHAEGKNTRSIGNYSHAENILTLAFGYESHAEGYRTCACGTGTHSEGHFTCAFGFTSHAEGNSTVASGNTSHSEGIATKTIGNYSHAEGFHTCTIGNDSHSEGSFTITCGSHSHAEGILTLAGGYASHSSGKGDSIKRLIANGRTSFIHSENTTGQTIDFGANADNSVILGGVNHNIYSGNTRAAIIGGCGINLTGTTYIDYTTVPNLVIWNTPGSGGTDDILTWNSNTKKINKVTQSSVSGSTANLITKTIFSTYTGTTVPATYLSKTNFTTYSGTTVPATYLSKTNFTTYSGTTVPATYLSKTNFTTYSGTTVPATYLSKINFTTYSGTTEPATYLKKTDFTTYSGTTAPATYASKASAITGATNLGTGTTIYTSVSANKIQLKSFKVSGLGISNDSNYITLSGVSNSSTADQTVTITNSNYTSGLTLNSNARIINIILDSTLTNDWAPSVISNVRQFGYYEFFITKNASVNITLSPLSRVYFEDSVDPFLDLADVEVGQMAIISARGLVRGIQFGRMIITDNKYNPPVFTNIFTTIFNQ